MTVIDRFTRWPEAIPVTDISAETVARTEQRFSQWIARYGALDRVTTDQGRQFESELFRRLAEISGTKHIRTAAYHPAANGMMERLHRQLKAAIKCHEESGWTDALPVALMGIRAAWKPDLGATAAELTFGENIRLPGDFLIGATVRDEPEENFVSQLWRIMAKLTPALKRHGQPRVFLSRSMETAAHVFIRRDIPLGVLQQKYEGPYEVKERGEKYYTVFIRGKEKPVSIDRLKPAYVCYETGPRKERPACVLGEPMQQQHDDAPLRRSERTRKPIVRFQSRV